MFKSLREKFSGWLKKGKKEEKKEKVVEEKGEEKEEVKEEKVVVEEEPSSTPHPPIQVEEVKKGKAAELVEEIETIDERVEEIKKEKEVVKEEGAHPAVKVPPPTQTQTSKLADEIPKSKFSPTQIRGAEKEADKEKGFFFKLKRKLSLSVLKQGEFDELFEDLEMTLLENNVALEVVDRIRKNLSEDLVGISIKRRDIEKTVVESLRNSILDVLVEKKDLFKEIGKRLKQPYVILFFGINGSGKTTSIAKLAYALKKKGLSCVMVAADTFRAASIEQLEEHGKKLGVEVVKKDYGADPAAVGFDGVGYAKKNKIDVVLIDTAGRMYTKANLMKEMEKIVRVVKPDLKVFVGESITGNDVVAQAKNFNESVGIDGIILSKADVDEKAGAILSVGHVTGKPILFLGTGQGYEDLKEFRKEEVLKNLGLG